jgi:hypothetical protein
MSNRTATKIAGLLVWRTLPCQKSDLELGFCIGRCSSVVASPTSCLIGDAMQRTIFLLDDTSDALSELLERKPDVGAFAASPLAFTAADDPAIADLRALPGVIGVDFVGERVFNLLHGLDHVALLTTGYHPSWSVGGVSPGDAYPVVSPDRGGGLPRTAGSAGCASVNISLEPDGPVYQATRPGDAVNHMTKYLSTRTVPVVAAGNSHDGTHEFETVSPWAEPNWVLSVGATEDREATKIASYSGRGFGSYPDVGPDILAYGASALDPNKLGTSFAAPRVAYMIALCTAWLFQVQANFLRLTQRHFGVPLIGVAIVDLDGEVRGDPEPTYPAMPVFHVAPTSEVELVDAMNAHGRWVVGPAEAKNLLLAAADAHGRDPLTNIPCITHASLMNFVSELDVARLFGILSGIEQTELRAGGSPLFSANTVSALDGYFEETFPRWLWRISDRSSQMVFGRRPS